MADITEGRRNSWAACRRKPSAPWLVADMRRGGAAGPHLLHLPLQKVNIELVVLVKACASQDSIVASLPDLQALFYLGIKYLVVDYNERGYFAPKWLSRCSWAANNHRSVWDRRSARPVQDKISYCSRLESSLIAFHTAESGRGLNQIAHGSDVIR